VPHCHSYVNMDYRWVLPADGPLWGPTRSVGLCLHRPAGVTGRVCVCVCVLPCCSQQGGPVDTETQETKCVCPYVRVVQSAHKEGHTLAKKR